MHTGGKRIVVWGAGSVGLVVGARLARAGEEVLFVCRNADSVHMIREHGVNFEDVASGESWSVQVGATSIAQARADEIANSPVLICVRTSQTRSAAEALARLVPDTQIVACVQNGIEGDSQLAHHFSTVIGVVYRQTCTRKTPHSVLSMGSGRLVVGLHPIGNAPAVTQLASRFEAAGYDVGCSEDIAQDRWLKLCANLMSAPNALIARSDHTTPEFVEIKTRLLEEARSALRAAGITARSCDGRDRSLDDEIEFQRTALSRGRSARSLPLYNQVWSALKHGGSVEADTYHRRILDLAATHGIETPMNARVLAALDNAVGHSLGPESLSATEVLSGGSANSAGVHCA